MRATFPLRLELLRSPSLYYLFALKNDGMDLLLGEPANKQLESVLDSVSLLL